MRLTWWCVTEANGVLILHLQDERNKVYRYDCRVLSGQTQLGVVVAGVRAMTEWHA